MINLENATVDFGGVGGVVLDRLSLTVRQGEFVSVVGSSGCGKSTLLNVIAGLDRPRSGVVAVESEPALIFQDPALFAWLSARENVALALHDKGMRRADRASEADRLLRLVGLAGEENKRPHEMSGGMRQRVAIARALARGSRLLLMDEPFSALDAITRDVLHEELVTLWKERGLTVVFVTHNVREAVTLGQRVILMAAKPGRIVNEWRVDEPHPRDASCDAVHFLERQITRALKDLSIGLVARDEDDRMVSTEACSVVA
jgi:NitT/TauT family transport system ATP-binding protein